MPVANKPVLFYGLEAIAAAGIREVGMVVGDTHEEGVRVGSKLLWFLNTSLKQAPQMSKFLPGRMPPEMAPAPYKATIRPRLPLRQWPREHAPGSIQFLQR